MFYIGAKLMPPFLSEQFMFLATQPFQVSNIALILSYL